MIILTVSRRTKLAAAEMKDHMTADTNITHLSTTVSPSHLYLHIYSSSCGYLRTEVTNKEVCVQAARANRQKEEGDVTSAAAGSHIMCHSTVLEPCSCILSHTAAC